MTGYERQAGFKQGQRVRVPNGEIGTVIDVFVKDGDLRVEVEMNDETWLTVNPIDLTVMNESGGWHRYMPTRQGKCDVCTRSRRDGRHFCPNCGSRNHTFCNR
jgi:hypothetical protein